MIRRGKLSGRKSNSGAWLVQMPSQMTPGPDPDGYRNGPGYDHDVDPDSDPEELAQLRHELTQASVRAARAEGELAGLREALSRADAALAQARAELAEARKLWVVRLLEAVRRK
jgi:hypothetical protein